MIGNPLFTDRLTKERKRTNYARIYVEIDTNCKYPNNVMVVVDNLPVEYNWRPQKCDLCDMFGHTSVRCANKGKNVKTTSGWLLKEGVTEDSIQRLELEEDQQLQETNRASTQRDELVEDCQQHEANRVGMQNLETICGIHQEESVSGERSPTQGLSIIEEGVARIKENNDNTEEISP